MFKRFNLLSIVSGAALALCLISLNAPSAHAQSLSSVSSPQVFTSPVKLPAGMCGGWGW